ncbi:MAG: hypothetical protein HYY97_01280 [Rhodocyclales bacterium]|nr:hypothetical protein [Rhodocyclales bacterium]
MRKQPKSNIKKRHLDLECLAANRYGVVGSTAIAWPGHPVKFSTGIHRLRQAASDLRKVQPDGSHCELVIDFSLNTILKLVVAGTAQGSLITNIESETASAFSPEGVASTGQSRSETDSNGSTDKSRQIANPAPSIEATALLEAGQIATATAKISMAAVDAGNSMVRTAEERGITLEEALTAFAKSPDELVSRRTYARAGGAAQTITYSSLGERELGGGRKVPAELHSINTFKLRRCQLTPGGRDGSFLLAGKDDDPEWQRLTDDSSSEFLLSGDKDGVAMQLLGYALASHSLVDVDVCLAERAGTKRRKLVPLVVHNRPEIVAGARDRLEFLEESQSE